MPEEKDQDEQAILEAVAQAGAVASETPVDDTTLRFVLTIEGDTVSKGTIRADGFQLNADGSVRSTAPVKTQEAENVVVALYDASIFLQTLSLTMARSLALATGDVLRALAISQLADSMGVTLPPVNTKRAKELQMLDPGKLRRRR